MNKLQENHKEKLSQAHCKCKQTYENSYLPNFSWTNPTRNTVQPTSLYPSRSSEQDVTSFAAGTDNSQSTLCPSCALKKAGKLLRVEREEGQQRKGQHFDYLSVLLLLLLMLQFSIGMQLNTLQ